MLDALDANILPPAGSGWLDAHHRAKLPERRAYCRRLAALHPSRILDVGCATGLWLDELDALLPEDCEFIGMDCDESALAEAAHRAKGWSRRSSFRQVDLNAPSLALPEADLTLLFNVSSYIASLDPLLDLLASRPGHVAVRQYDGATLRFGPMVPEDRAIIEASHRIEVRKHCDLRHYDLDRLYATIERAPFTCRDISFELFSRSSPFPREFADYLSGTMWWTLNYLSDSAGRLLRSWWEDRQLDPTLPTYFAEVDLCAILS